MRQNYLKVEGKFSHSCGFSFFHANRIFLQQAGGAIVMDADATSALHRKGVATTDDSFKFIWFQVCMHLYL